MTFTLQQLRHFVAIAETGQVSRAARRCHIAQPSITASLRNLEKAMGVPLFLREPRGLRLTDNGERFYRHAARVLGAAEEATEAMAQPFQELAGRVRIGVTETITAYLLPDLLRATRRRYPSIQMEAVEQDRASVEQSLRSGAVDFAIVLVSNLDSFEGLEHQTLTHSPRRLWAAAGHPLLNSHRVTLEDVAAEPYILLNMDEHVRTVERYWASRQLKPNVVFCSSSLEAVRSLIAQGAGVSILSDLVYRPWSLDGDRIIRRDVTDSVPTMDVGIVWARGAELSDATQALITMLDSSFRTFERPL